MDSLDVGSGNFLVWLEVEKHALSAGRGDPAVAVEEGLDCFPQPVSGTIVHVAGHSDNLCLLLDIPRVSGAFICFPSIRLWQC